MWVLDGGIMIGSFGLSEVNWQFFWVKIVIFYLGVDVLLNEVLQIGCVY